MKKKTTYLNLQYIILCIFAFVVSFSTPTISYLNFTPTLLGVLALVWLLERNFRARFQRIKTNKMLLPLLLCGGLYLLYAIGMLYSTNLDFGKKDLLLKLPLLFLPLFFSTSDTSFFTKKRMLFLLKLFAAGNIVAIIASLAHSYYLYLQDPSLHAFHYTNASWFHHPSYASIYYCFSFAIILFLIFTDKLKIYEKIIGVIGLILFITEIALLDSRAGILAFGATILVFGTYIFTLRHITIKAIIITTCLAITLIGTYFLIPENINRVQRTIKQFDKGSLSISDPENANPRILSWDATLKIALKNTPFGVGTGDIKDELREEYLKNNYTEPYSENHNAHNQYLQLFATLGILGILIFFIILFLPFGIGLKRKNILFVIFGVIICINFFFESMLEKQVGAMFFCFFFPLLYFLSQQSTENQQA